MTNELYSTLVIFSHLKQLDIMPAKLLTAQSSLTEEKGSIRFDIYFSENVLSIFHLLFYVSNILLDWRYKERGKESESKGFGV